MPFPPGNILLKRFHFPHFVFFPTRSRVLHTYKLLQREASRFVDPLSRSHLRNLIYESFAAYKYVNQEKKVNALLDIAEKEIGTLEKASSYGSPSAMDQVLYRVLTTYRIKELPLKSLLNIDRLDHRDINFRLNNLPIPSPRTFSAHEKAVKRNSDLFFRYINTLKKNKITSGKNGRKISFIIPYEGTILGTPLPKNREKNMLKKYYNTMLNNIPRPIHSETMEYLESQYSNPQNCKFNNLVSQRKYRRRLLYHLCMGFTISKNSKKTGDLFTLTYSTVIRNTAIDKKYFYID